MTLWSESFLFQNITEYNSTVGELGERKKLNETNYDSELYPPALIIPFTVVYIIIFLTGLVGNISTCIVIARNKSMHTATNYYLFSLAISDLLLLVSGLPPETYRLWSPDNYIFGEAFCFLQGFAAETSANATVLTITAFTVERYVAICHPFLSHTMSKLSRAVKYVFVIWITALCLAAPQAIHFGVEYDKGEDGVQLSRCTVVSTDSFFERAFQVSTFLFFVGPMTVITVLYVLIAAKLKQTRIPTVPKRSSSRISTNFDSSSSRSTRSCAAQKRVIKMLVAVVVAFFVCWAPFHAQRLLAVYLTNASPETQEKFINLYIVLMYASGVLYFLSTTINPVLYHIMSRKFREAFKATLSQICGQSGMSHFHTKMYSSFTKHPPSLRQCDRTHFGSVQHFRVNNSKKNQCPDADLSNTDNTNSNEVKYTPVVKETSLVVDMHASSRFRSRMSSESSQATVVTNMSKSLSLDDQYDVPMPKSTKKIQHEPHNRNAPGISAKASANVGVFKKGVFNIFQKRHVPERKNVCLRQGSVESAFSSNTISNSSLQNMDESEFTSSDLVRYMEEVNSNIT